MKISRCLLLKNKFFFFFFMLLMLYPKFIDYSSGSIYWSLRTFIRNIPYVILPLLILFFWNCNRHAYKFYLGLTLFHFAFLISDIYNDASISAILIWYKNFVWALFVAVYICSLLSYYPEKTLFYLKRFCNVVCIINLILMVLFPDGIAKIEMFSMEWKVVSWTDSVNFIDVDNRLSLFILLTIFLNYIWKYYKYGKILTWKYLIIPIITMLLGWSGTGLIAVFWVLSYLMFSRRKYIAKIVSGYWIFLAYGVIFILFVVLQNFQIFEFVIVNILNKTMDISNRTMIWAYYIGLIFQHPFVGYGTEELGALMNMNGTVWYAHNQILDIITQGGVLAFAMFVVWIIFSKHHIDKCSSTIFKGIFNAVLLGYLIIGIAEHFLVSFNLCFYVFVSVGYGFSYILNKNEYLQEG